MYSIKTMDSSIGMKTLCRFSLMNGRVRFEKGGDAKFISSLHEAGVPYRVGRNMTQVRPSDGTRFIEACLDHFCGAVACNDEAALEQVRRLYPSPTPKRDSFTPPASVA